MGLALLFWSPLRARLHIVPKPWMRTGRTARSALLAPFAPANGGDHVGGYDRKQLTATGGVAGPSMAPMRKPTCTPAPSAIAASRPCGFIPISSIVEMTASTECRHWSPPSPAMMAPSRVCSAPGLTPSDPPRPISFARVKRSGASTAGRALWRVPLRCAPACRQGIETVLSLVTAVPRILAAATLSAGSHGAFEPPQDLALLVIARDKDMEGEHAANRLQHRCAERGIPSIVIVPDRSDFNDDLVAVGADTLAARLSPLIASTQPAATGEERGGSGRIITPS